MTVSVTQYAINKLGRSLVLHQSWYSVTEPKISYLCSQTSKTWP